MGIGMIIGVVIVLVFLYYIFTNPTLMSYAKTALSLVNSTSSGITQLLNLTKGMNESAFVAWAKNPGNPNPLIQSVKSMSNNATIQSNLDTIWAQTKSGNSTALVDTIEHIISTGKP
jgi:hypothetical protein